MILPHNYFKHSIILELLINCTIIT